MLDAGGGLDASYWDTLVPELAKRTGREIITYDRAGFGTSDEVSDPWNLQSATDDLANGLAKLGATQGVIMVSHSLAGEIATELAIRHPHWLAGAVLVDANVPDFFNAPTIEALSAQYAPMVRAAKANPSTKEARQLISLAASFIETSQAFNKLKWPAEVPVVVMCRQRRRLTTPPRRSGGATPMRHSQRLAATVVSPPRKRARTTSPMTVLT